MAIMGAFAVALVVGWYDLRSQMQAHSQCSYAVTRAMWTLHDPHNSKPYSKVKDAVGELDYQYDQLGKQDAIIVIYEPWQPVQGGGP